MQGTYYVALSSKEKYYTLHDLGHMILTYGYELP